MRIVAFALKMLGVMALIALVLILCVLGVAFVFWLFVRHPDLGGFS